MLKLRAAAAGDMELYYEWANDPSTRQNAFNQERIEYAEHASWFSNKLASDSALLLVAEDEHGVPVGQIRFDIADDTAEISFSIAGFYRGRGLGAEILRLGCQALRQRLGCKVRICGYVKTGNTPSNKAFIRAGFEKVGEQVERKGALCNMYQLG